MSPLGLAEGAVREALAEGAEEAEAYVWASADLQASALGTRVSAKESRTGGVGVRAVRRGALGFASGCLAGPASAARVAARAAQLAALLPATGARLPERAPDKGGRGPAYDADLAALDAEGAVRAATRGLREARAAGGKARLAFASATLSRSRYRFAVASSRGIAAEDRGVRASLEVECRVTRGAEERSGTSERSARAGFRPAGAGREARERAEALLGARPQRKAVLDVVLDPGAAGLLASLLAAALAGGYVAEGRSVLGGKVGEAVGPASLTVRDGPGLGGPRAQRWDDEGLPAADRALVERGTLRGFLLDSASAAKLGLPSTGNGLRGDAERYRSAPTATPMGLAVDPGKGEVEDLVAEVRRGLLVRWGVMGLSTLDRVTGRFSVVAPSPFAVRRGEVAGPVRPTTLSGDLQGVLRELRRIGADGGTGRGGGTPSLLVGGLTCAG